MILGLFISGIDRFVLGDLVEVWRGPRLTTRCDPTRVVDTNDGKMLPVPNSSGDQYTQFPHIRIDIPFCRAVQETLGRGTLHPAYRMCLRIFRS